VLQSKSIKTIIDVNIFIFAFRSNGRAAMQVYDNFNQSSVNLFSK
jgi:hypothetical protein